MNEIQKIAQTALREALARQKPPKTNWLDSPMADLMHAEIDTRGSIGELLTVKLLKAGGRKPVFNPDKTAAAKDWDFMCDGLTYEVKTASAGKNGRTFQHEHIFKTRHYDGMILVDIAPDEIYISMWAKAEIPWRELHRRKDGSYYKWDTSLTSPKSYDAGRLNKWCVRDNAVRRVADFMARFAQLEADIKAKQRPPSDL